MQKDDFYSYLNILVISKNDDMFLYSALILGGIVKIGLVGLGNVGKELHRRLKLKNHDVYFTVNNHGVYDRLGNKMDEKDGYLNCSKQVDVICLAIPTLDDGKTAFDYMNHAFNNGKLVVTCEKGALSNYFKDLENNMGHLGYSATVGGGTRLLQYGQQRMNSEVVEIHAIINGTLNFVFDQVSKGRSLGEVIREAKKLGYAEPGAESTLDVINTEANSDVPMKTAILFNMFGLGEVSANELKKRTKTLTEDNMRTLIKESQNRRYIVSITREDSEENKIGGFKKEVNDWQISAGFKNITENPLYMQLAVSGVNNSLLICDGKDSINGNYRISGPGAGAEPTTTAMLLDLENLLKH